MRPCYRRSRCRKSSARRRGWVSRSGEVLGRDLVCSRTGERYQENDGELVLAKQSIPTKRRT
ncbi:MAG: hypothetical protein HC872_02655 [Gammaproteobacteria bacterium]|nr:hypothetical protein [Gammaproteobacteria bacterium]